MSCPSTYSEYLVNATDNTLPSSTPRTKGLSNDFHEATFRFNDQLYVIRFPKYWTNTKDWDKLLYVATMGKHQNKTKRNEKWNWLWAWIGLNYISYHHARLSKCYMSAPAHANCNFISYQFSSFCPIVSLTLSLYCIVISSSSPFLLFNQIDSV